jgi:60 kDa SS-A/Ro ribonucleoprotein
MTFSNTGLERTIKTQAYDHATNRAETQMKYVIDSFTALSRFLILGGGDSASTIIEDCMARDPARTINEIVRVSMEGLAPKNDHAVYALAVACSTKVEGRTYGPALAAIPKVCRIGTHICQFVGHIKNMRGFGRAMRRALTNWYATKSADQMAFQVVKYQNREGFTHRDIFRLVHPSGAAWTPEHATVARWIVEPENTGNRTIDTEGGGIRSYPAVNTDNFPRIIKDYRTLKTLSTANVEGVCKLIRNSDLTHEMLPTEFKRSPEVWKALIPKMGMTAIIRNLGVMSSLGVFNDEQMLTLVCDRLTNDVQLKQARVHPLNVLSGVAGSSIWTVYKDIAKSLEKGFYLSFKYVEPSGRSLLIANDVSGSMSWANSCSMKHLRARDVAAVLSMVIARVERNSHIYAFSNELEPLPIEKTDSLDTVFQKMNNVYAGSTRIELPFQFALDEKLDVDCFVTITDNDVNMGGSPQKALNEYRAKCNRRAKSIVLATSDTEFSVADPRDPLSLDLAGFSADVPGVISAFANM